MSVWHVVERWRLYDFLKNFYRRRFFGDAANGYGAYDAWQVNYEIWTSLSSGYGRNLPPPRPAI